MNKDDILKIPDMKRAGMTNKQIALDLGVHVQTIILWIRKLRLAGHDVPKKMGRPKIQL